MKLFNISKDRLIAILLGMGLVLASGTFAAYNDIVVSGTTAQLSIGGSTVDFSVENGNVENLTINDSDITFDLAGNSAIYISSSNKKNFSIEPTDIINSFECGTSASSLSVSRTASQSTVTVKVTPQSTTCTTTGSGGSGGGSGGTGVTTATTETTTAVAQETVSTPAATTATTPSAGTVAVVPQTTVTPSVTTPQVIAPQAQAISPVFSAGLKKGTENSDVERLQKLLATDSEIYPEGKITGYYGSLTEKAVQRFQMKYEVVSSASDPGYGYLGPKTRAKIEEVFSGVTESVSAPSAEVTVSVTLSRELDPGMSGSDVKALQEFLNSDPDTRIAESGVGSPGSETEHFGDLTAKAVKKFQAKYGISTVGRVGPQTLQKLNELMSASAPQSSVQSSSSISETQDTSALQAQLLQATSRLQELQQQLQSLLGQ